MCDIRFEVEKIILSIMQEDKDYEFTMQTDLVDDLGFDSLQVVSMVVLLEERCDCLIPDKCLSFDVLRNYGTLIDLLENLKGLKKMK